MTRMQMTELFTIMSLAWPQAEMFRGGIANLGPTITLWTNCTPDVDFQLGQIAVFQLCQTCRFPPTIAEFRKAVSNVVSGLENEALERWNMLLLWGKEEFQRIMAGDSATNAVVRQIGPDGNWYQFLDAYKSARIQAKARDLLPNSKKQALIGGKN